VSPARLLALGVALAVALASWAATCAAWRADRVMAGTVPLDPRRFEAFTLVTLGTGGAFENPDRLGPATAVARGERVALVEAGRGVAEALRAARIPTRQPDSVYLTSLLPENTAGLDDLLATGWLDGRSRSLRVVGPPGTAALVQALEAAHAAGVEASAAALGLPPEGARMAAVEIAEGFAERREGLVARAGAMPGGPLAAFAWRFEADGRSAVVAGMGWAPEALVDFARGADVLVHEAVYVPTPEVAAQAELDVAPERLAREARLHTSIDAVGGLAQSAGVGRLVLVRLRPPPVYALQLTSRIDDRFQGAIVVANDGDEIRP
jgi:ribonuclease BN (tRNA processing enzyme)